MKFYGEYYAPGQKRLSSNWENPRKLLHPRMNVGYPEAAAISGPSSSRLAMNTGGLVSCNALAVGFVHEDEVAIYLSHAQRYYSAQQIEFLQVATDFFTSKDFSPHRAVLRHDPGNDEDDPEGALYDKISGVIDVAVESLPYHFEGVGSYVSIEWHPKPHSFEVTYNT